jgi:hypothetical protein
MTKASEQTALALFDDELAADADAAAKTEAPGVQFISTKSGILTIGGSPVAGNALDVVIIGSPVERLFYPGRFDPTKAEAPACSAISATNTDCKPSLAVLDRQHETCAGCPRDAWGSSLSGGKGKACKETRRLLLISSSDTKDAGAVASAGLAIVRPPVTSLTNWSLYVQSVAARTRKPLFAVITTVSLKPDAKSQYKMHFELKEIIEDIEVVRALKARGLREVERALQSSVTEGEDDHAEEAPASTKF